MGSAALHSHVGMFVMSFSDDGPLLMLNDGPKLPSLSLPLTNINYVLSLSNKLKLHSSASRSVTYATNNLHSLTAGTEMFTLGIRILGNFASEYSGDSLSFHFRAQELGTALNNT